MPKHINWHLWQCGLYVRRKLKEKHSLTAVYLGTVAWKTQQKGDKNVCCSIFSSKQLMLTACYIAQYKWSRCLSVQSVAGHSATLSYQQTLWIQSSCQYPFIFHAIYFLCSWALWCCCVIDRETGMSAYMRLHECPVAADCATESPKGYTANAVRFGRDDWGQTGNAVLVVTSCWRVWKLKRQGKENGWLRCRVN